ncbi:MAG: branched-chain amino acid ABC transporter permease [Deltaproteobacteria bacterium]|jgi:branched-chain amino acid transport system permease protein|nr:branched-chain amino acid ABC transporter permease [Deltaproteobacteria bacterium]
MWQNQKAFRKTIYLLGPKKKMDVLIIGTIRGSLYSLIAVGFVLIFSVGGILNLAHGTYYMLGAYLTFVFYHLVLHSGAGGTLVLSMVLAVASVAALACLVYYLLLRKKIESLIYTMVMTLALALFVSEIMSLLFGVSGSSVPSLIEGHLVISGVKIISHQLILLPIAALILPGLWIFLKKTKMGQSIDAVSQHRTGALLMGVSVEKATLVTSGLSAGLAALAGALIAPVSAVVPEMWLFPLIKAFAIAILGGMGSLTGSIIASFLLGYAEVLTSFLISEQLTEMISLVVIVFVLIFKPAGIMGYKSS